MKLRHALLLTALLALGGLGLTACGERSGSCPSSGSCKAAAACPACHGSPCACPAKK